MNADSIKRPVSKSINLQDEMRLKSFNSNCKFLELDKVEIKGKNWDMFYWAYI